MRNLLLLLSSIGLTTSACAQTTPTSGTLNVPSDPPYIVLSANLDEPNGYGFCMDTYGAGQSDLMQTHSCKPAKAEVMSYAFEGYCMQALIASEVTVFALLQCSDHPRQKFVYSTEDESLRLAEDQDRCVTVASETVPAGPWVKRPLQLEACDEVDTSLRRWTLAL